MTPTTFPHVPAVSRPYTALVQEHERPRPQLEEACAELLAAQLSYRVCELPPTLDHTPLVFTGLTLEWITPPLGDDGVYDLYVYEPLLALRADVATFPRDKDGTPMPLLCWQGVLWAPTVHYACTRADGQERLVWHRHAGGAVSLSKETARC